MITFLSPRVNHKLQASSVWPHLKRNQAKALTISTHHILLSVYIVRQMMHQDTLHLVHLMHVSNAGIHFSILTI